MDILLKIACPKCKKSDELITEKKMEKMFCADWESKDNFLKLKEEWKRRFGAAREFEKKGDYKPGENSVFIEKFFCADCMICFCVSMDISHQIMACD